MFSALTTTMLSSIASSPLDEDVDDQEDFEESSSVATYVRSLKNGSEITCVSMTSDDSLCGFGDRSGRIVVLRDGSPLCEFKSHEPEFDCLKSLEIEEKVTGLEFCRAHGPCPVFLATNDKTIKLWKVAGGELPTLKRVFGNAHAYHINSLSLNSDGETFCSSDDLRVNIWSLEVAEQTFNVVDLKTQNMEDLTEVITSTSFHPTRCYEMMYSTSRGCVKLFDLRKSARCGEPVSVLGESEDESDSNSSAVVDSFLAEIVASVSDARFVGDDYILARDYFNLRLFDTRKSTTTPLHTFSIHDHLKTKLHDLYDSDRIFDKFQCAASHDNDLYFSGSYSSSCHAFSPGGGRYALTPPPEHHRKLLRLASSDDSYFESSLSSAAGGVPDQTHKVLNLASSQQTLAFAVDDTLHFYDLCGGAAGTNTGASSSVDSNASSADVEL